MSDQLILKYNFSSSGSSPFQFTLPIQSLTGSSVSSNLIVTWSGLGTQPTPTIDPLVFTYTDKNLPLTVYISGPNVKKFSHANNSAAPYLIECIQFNNNLESLYGAFMECIQLVDKIPTTLPTSVTDISYMFAGARNFIGDINGWNTTNVINMAGIFQGANIFNSELNNWVVSNVINMERMFFAAERFNKDLNNWDVSNVENMDSMFRITPFNRNITNWNTSKVKKMSSMFNGARAFNQNISTNGTAWDVSKVEDMTSMFTDATSFRGNIGNWNTISVTKMTNMFYNATSFDQNIGGWNTSNVQKMDGMFYGTTSFNIDISQWDTSNVDNMNGMFWNATLFNQNINTDGLKWNTSKVKTMTSMFYGASKFNGNITKWNTSNVEDMSYMFYQALKFNQNINYNETYNAWNVTKVTHMTSMFSEAFDFNGDVSKWDTKLVRNMTGLFMYTKFNQDVSNWNVSTVQNMNDMFNGASLFDQDLSKWNITSITNILSMIANTSMSIDNYNKLLNSWSTKQVQLYINFSNNGLIYTDSGKNGRDILRQKWAITNDLYIDREILNPNVPFNITHNNTTSPSKLYITDYNITPDINSPYYSSTNSQYQNVIITTNGKKRITIKNNSNSILYTGYIYVINKMVTDINIPDTIIKNYGDPSQLLNITSTNPSTITYVSRNTNIVTIENNYLVFHNGGTTIIDVTQPDTTNYTSVTRQFTVIVNPIISVINVISNRILIVGNETFPIPISTNETTPFIFESNDSETIGVDNINKRFILKKVGGPVTITVNQAASANFLAASTTFTVTVLPVPCVLKGTKINTEKGYKEVEKLTTEDNVKTVDGYKKVYKISHRSMEHHAVNKRIPDQLYEYVTDNEEPLILTGRHSILVDSLTTEESEKVKEMFGRLYTTENKYRLAVCIDAKSNVYAIPGTYEVYHVALENNNEYTNYGMYANGILVETMSKKNSDKYNNFNMDTIYNAKK